MSGLRYDPARRAILSRDGDTVATLRFPFPEGDPLLGPAMAAGPDLLEAATNLLKVLFDPHLRTEESMIDGADFVNQALALRAAIAKAAAP